MRTNCSVLDTDDDADMVDGFAVISIAGGTRDTLVRADLSLMDAAAAVASHSILTTSIPGLWLSVDHQVSAPISMYPAHA